MLSIGSLRSALSAERLSAYALPDDIDEVDSVARYLWNLALCSALQPALHTLEITVRNHLLRISGRIVDQATLRFDKVPCWLDAQPSLLANRERQAVETAKSTIASRSRPMTEGRLVSALGFGFWVSLCKKPYDQGRAGRSSLWPELATRGFPHLPKAQRTRSQIFHALDPLRDLRNRVSHHESVWDRKLNRSHQDILETIGWINLDLATTLRAHSPLPEVLERGVAGFRAQAEAIIK
ncbi:MAG: hypothetical protein OXI39_09565 [Gemmatimonadota bacterium]|uniref:hypothetical protein n=1 Tax=Candidatus Palauibacter scopulicola TaxID=3056741 RepID=UPI0023A2B528|nr:hypothetical protein [Candidatus Palauibacter scopulicola]MDE2663232.1 hypothetical protein [Candidatus Palauibacter scopulicola]